MKAALVAAALTMALAAAVPGHALISSGVLSECTGVTVDGDGSCSTTFNKNMRGFVSNLDTHGHFHGLLPTIGPRGFVTLEWIDATGETVYSSFCQDDQGGIFDGMLPGENVTCASVYHKTTYAAGTQNLFVTADKVDGADGVTFHGRLFVSDGDELI